MLHKRSVLRKPLLTEKIAALQDTRNQYAFEVDPSADKHAIRRAVEEMFHVKVEKVRTQNRRGKSRRYRFRVGETSAWKKAIVTLNSEHHIDFF